MSEAAQDHQETLTTALDVERLTEAMHIVRNHTFDGSQALHHTGKPSHPLGDDLRREAIEVAAEYALLSAGDKAEAPRAATEPELAAAVDAARKEVAAIKAGTHVPAVDDFGNQYLAPRAATEPPKSYWMEFLEWEQEAAKQGSGMTADQMTGAAMFRSWLVNEGPDDGRPERSLTRERLAAALHAVIHDMTAEWCAIQAPRILAALTPTSAPEPGS